MHEYLVTIEIALPDDMARQQLDDLTEHERARGAELVAEGAIVRIWRLPGRRANVGLWRAADATELHDRLASLPMFPYMNVDVMPLARHPLEEV